MTAEPLMMHEGKATMSELEEEESVKTITQAFCWRWSEGKELIQVLGKTQVVPSGHILVARTVFFTLYMDREGRGRLLEKEGAQVWGTQPILRADTSDCDATRSASSSES